MLCHQIRKNDKSAGTDSSKYLRGDKVTEKLLLRQKPKWFYHKALQISKFFFGSYFLLALLGYQPIIGLPPIRNTLEVRAENTQEQTINSSSFSEAVQLPNPGYLTTHFLSYHKGVDIATGLGMPVRPILRGTVVKVEYGFFGYGHMVVVEHEQGLKSLYAHMGRMFVRVGQAVEKTSILGEIGMTGRTTGPHTHLEVYKNDVSFDPLTILPPVETLPKPEYIAKVKQEAEVADPTISLYQQPLIARVKAVKPVEPEPEINLKKELSFNL